jgi:hypothetical protein
MRGQKPAGIESGVALNTLLEQDSVRHSDVFRSWESAHVQLAKIQIEMWRLLAARDPKFELQWGDDTELRRVKWREIDLDKSRYRMRAWPTNLFGSTPTAKLQGIMDLFKTGGIPTEQLVMVLTSQFPDIRALFGDENSLLSNIERKLASVVEEGSVTPENAPHGNMNLPLARRIGVARQNALEAGGASQDKVAAVAQWLSLLSQVEGEQPPPAQPGANAGMPPAPAPAKQGVL